MKNIQINQNFIQVLDAEQLEVDKQLSILERRLVFKKIF